MRQIIFATLLLASCATYESEVIEVTSKQGLRNVSVGGFAHMSCSKDDKTGRKFTATNSGGQQVSGVVCCGVWKGCTIRW